MLRMMMMIQLMLTKQIDYLKKAIRLFSAFEMAGFLKIAFQQTLTKVDVNEMNKKYGIEEKMDVLCSCGGEDTGLHRLFYCDNYVERCRILKLKIGERWRKITHPLELVFMCGGVSDLVCVIKNVLLHSNGVGLLKYKYYNIISSEILHIQKNKLKKLKSDIK